MKVLLTDGNHEHTLAAVRSLGKRNINATILSDLNFSISFYSKYCNHYIIVPNPKKDDKFSDPVLDISGDYDVLLPISFASVSQISKIKEKLEKYVKVPMADVGSMEIKPKFWGSLELAVASGVDFPYLACVMAMNGVIKPVFEYKNCWFRWLFLGDIFHEKDAWMTSGKEIWEWWNESDKVNTFGDRDASEKIFKKLPVKFLRE
jgi:hypothetical protein